MAMLWEIGRYMACDSMGRLFSTVILCAVGAHAVSSALFG